MVADGEAVAVLGADVPPTELANEAEEEAAEVAGAPVLLDAQLTASGTVTP
jgi:hypothetical protein